MAIIKLKKGSSGVTPTGLTLAEPAFDYKDYKLYVGVTSSAIWVGGEVDNNTALGTSQIKIPTQFAVKTYIDNLGLSPGVVVTGVNGVTGAVTLGVTAGPGLSIVNPTGSGKGITLINTGVLSVVGRTGAVTNIAVTDAAQSFSGIQTFANGITVSGNSTFLNTLRTDSISNRQSGSTFNIFTLQPDASVADFDIVIAPKGNLVLKPEAGFLTGTGSSPVLYISGTDAGSGEFQFRGGNLRIGGLNPGGIGSGVDSPVSIRFTPPGTTFGIFLRGITAENINSNTLVQIPNHSGLMVVPSNLGTSGFILRASGVTAQPTWVNANSAGFTAYAAQEVVGGAAGNLLYQSAIDNTSFVTNAGTTGFFLTYNTTSNTPTWVNPNTVGFTAYGSTVSVNLQGGAAGSLPYNTGANTTGFLGIGSAGTILTSTGSAPQWSTATGLTVGTAQNISVTAETSDTTNYLIFVNNNTNSNQAPEYNSSLVYNAVTNFLEANIDGGSY